MTSFSYKITGLPRPIRIISESDYISSPLDWQLERSSSEDMVLGHTPRGTCVGKSPRENPGMLEVPKETRKDDNGWMRGVSWSHIHAGNDAGHGDE